VKHVEQDRLLEYTLELLDSEILAEVEEHLASCADCRDELDRIRRDTSLIEGIEIEPPRMEIMPPRRRAFRWNSLARAAALLLFGFMTGYGTSTFFTGEAVRVVPQQLLHAAPAASIHGFVTCESVDAGVRLPDSGGGTMSDSLGKGSI